MVKLDWLCQLCLVQTGETLWKLHPKGEHGGEEKCVRHGILSIPNRHCFERPSLSLTNTVAFLIFGLKLPTMSIFPDFAGFSHDSICH